MSVDDDVEVEAAAPAEAVKQAEAPAEAGTEGKAPEGDAVSQISASNLAPPRAVPDVAALAASDEAVQLVPAKVVAPAKAVRAKRAAKAAPAKMPRCRREGTVEVVKHYTSQMFIIRL